MAATEQAVLTGGLVSIASTIEPPPLDRISRSLIGILLLVLAEVRHTATSEKATDQRNTRRGISQV